MAQDYERKDNRPKMCFKGDWTKDHHVKDFTPDFCPSVFCFYSCALFSAGIHSLPFFFWFLVLVLSCLCFSCVCTFSLSAGWVQYSSEHRNLIVYDLERTFLVLVSSVEGDPWSRLMKEIIRLKRGQLADNFIIVKG